MALFKSAESQKSRPVPTLSQAGQSVSIRGKYSLKVALADEDFIQLLLWPANTVLEDFYVDLDTLDSNATPTIIPKFGILNAAGDGLLGEVMLSVAAADAKLGGLFRPTLFVASRSQPKSVDRYLGMRVETGPATGVAPVSVTLDRGVWKASTAYALGDFLDLPNGTRQKVTTAGTSGTAIPDFATVKAATVTDGGTLVWTNVSVVIGMTATFRNQNFGS